MYDNEHFVRYISVVEQFANCATEHCTGGVRTACLCPSLPRLTGIRCATRTC